MNTFCCGERGCPGVDSCLTWTREENSFRKELGLPIKFIGLGEQPDDLQPFDAKQFAQALFKE
jgi:hypothetical protein